jgi:hypothetical protein
MRPPHPSRGSSTGNVWMDIRKEHELVLFSPYFFPVLFQIICFPVFFSRILFSYFFLFIFFPVFFPLLFFAVLFSRISSNVTTKTNNLKKYGKKVRGKKYGKKSKGKSHVISGQACAMVRSSGSSTNNNLQPHIYYSYLVPGRVGWAHARSEGTKNEFI